MTYYTILYYTMLYYTILYYTILYYTILYYTVLYYTMQYYTILCNTILYYTILYYTMLCYTILYYAILYYAMLYYTIQYHTILYSPGERYKNQIDYILLDKKFRSGIMTSKTRSFPGADIGSDHNLVMTTIKIKLKKVNNSNNARIKFDLEKLNDPLVKQEFENKIGGRFAPLLLLDDMQQLVDEFSDKVKETAYEVLGKRRKVKNPWITNEVLSLCDQRRNLKSKKSHSEEDLDKYRNANRKVRQEIIKAKEQWIDKECDIVEENLKRNNSKTAFGIINNITKRFTCRTTAVEDNTGKILTEPTAVKDRWTEYCRELHNYKITTDQDLLKELKNTQPLPEDATYDNSLLMEEVIQAIEGLKKRKAPGFDNIPAELLQAGGNHVHRVLHKICNEAWKANKWPEQWTKSLLIPLYKKGNTKKCQNYRTISLISHPSKVLLKIILNRLKPHVEQLVSREQAGFRKGRSTTEQITNLRILCQKYKEKGRNLYHHFIDFRKAFDRVWQEALWATMKRHNIDHKLVYMIMALYNDTENAVLINNTLGEWFTATVGVRQGCLLSPYLFNIFLEQIMIDTLETFQGTVSINGETVSNLRFADDIDLLAGSEEELIVLTSSLHKTSLKFGMELNADKCKIMITGGKDERHGQVNIRIDDRNVEVVDSFCYLGSYITDDCKSTRDVKARLAMALDKMTQLNTIWKNKKVSTKSKIRLLRAIILSVAFYGCQSWTLTKELEARIKSFEFKCYRRLLRIPYTEHKSNEEVKNRIELEVGKVVNLLEVVRKRKLQWFGHVVRQGADSLAKTILEGMVDGKRNRGRPEKSWMNNIIEWTGMKVVDLIKSARDRKAWKTIVGRSAIVPPRPDG